MIAQLDKLYMRLRPSKIYSRLVSYFLFEGRPLTTRGQWINPFVFLWFRLWAALPQLKRVESPVFVLGTGRSGTTVLGLLLSMHKQVGFLNEPKALWHCLYPSEDLIGSYTNVPASYRLDSDAVGPRVVKKAQRLFGAYLFWSCSSRVVDKYPELIFRVPFVRAIFPDAKFLFLVRDGRDTCQSIEGWSERLGLEQEEETHDWWGKNRRKWDLLVDQLVSEHPDLAPLAAEMRSWNKQVDMAAVEWIVSMREGLRLVERYPQSVLRVDYESMCENPSAVLKGIEQFAGLDVGDEVFHRYAEATMKSGATRESFVLPPSLVEPFEQTMKALGYV